MRKILWLTLLGSTLLLQSCFEIVEQLFLKNDGSGNLQLVINMSKSKTKLNAIMKMKTVNGHKVPDKNEVTQQVAAIEQKIRGTAGISNVNTSLDFENYIATLTCDFINVSCLNAGIKNIAQKQRRKQEIANVYEYNGARKTFSRLNKLLIKNEYEEMSNADKEIFATAMYTGIFKFEREITSASNKDGRISANKKAVMVKLNALDVINNKKTIENKIQL